MSLVLIIIIMAGTDGLRDRKEIPELESCHRSHFGQGLEPWLNDHLMFLAPPIIVFLVIYKYVMHGKYRKSFVGDDSDGDRHTLHELVLGTSNLRISSA